MSQYLFAASPAQEISAPPQKRWKNPGSVYGFKEVCSCSINVTYIYTNIYIYIQKVYIFTSVHCMAIVGNIRYHIVRTCKAI